MDGHDELLSVPQSIIIVVVSSDGESDISSALIVEEGLLELVISIPFIILLAVGIVCS
jgi:ABC-type methionine transport system permease subunit